MSQPASPAQTLAEELASCQALLEVLKNEQDLLIRADVEGLGKAAEEKGRLVAKMNELAQRRHKQLAASGEAAGEAGMQTWLKRVKPGQQVEQDWTSLIELAHLAKELNRTNGMLINQHMARTQHALNTLKGEQNGEQLYAPNGQTSGGGSGRLLVVG